jgi:flavodoxin
VKLLVISFTLSGNTKKIAQAFHDEAMDLGYEPVLESLGKIALVILGKTTTHNE